MSEPAQLVIEHERDEQWAWPKGMEDKEYGPFCPGVTRGREPHGGGKWHVTLTAVAVVDGQRYAAQHSWIDRDDQTASLDATEAKDAAGKLDALWAQLDARVRKQVEDRYVEYVDQDVPGIGRVVGVIDRDPRYRIDLAPKEPQS